MTVTLSDFTWAVRPTVSDVELTDGGDIVASSGWTAGVGGWAAWDTTTALEALTDEYTIVVVLDPNQASSAWRGLLSIPAYASGAHASPYHVMLLAASGLGDPTKRDRKKVREDLRNELISATAAQTVYGLEV